MNYLFYALSIAVYAAYIWVAEVIDFSADTFVRTTHGSGVFWFTVFFIAGVTLVLDAGIEYVRITYFKNGSDYIREFVADKMGEADFDETKGVQVSPQDVKDFEQWIEPIYAYWRGEELKREAELEEARNKKAKEAAAKMSESTNGKVVMSRPSN